MERSNSKSSGGKKMKAITVIEAKEQEAKEKRIIMDIRSPEYFQYDHIPEAVNIPYDEIENGNYYLPNEYKYLLYCEHGTQSMAASRILEADHFQTLSVIGGMTAYHNWNDRQSRMSGKIE